MSASLYALPGSNRVPGATITVVDGLEDPDYPAGNLGILNPAKPAKLLEAAGAWLVDLGQAYAIDLAAIIHHNLAPEAVVLLEANSVDDWDAAPLSELMAVPDYDADGYPRNPWIDIAAIVPDAADRTYRYWRLSVTGSTDPVAIGELVLASGRLTFEADLQPGLGDDEDIPSKEHKTDVTTAAYYVIGAKTRSWSGELDLTEEANIQAARTLYQASHGKALGFLIVPNPAVTDAWFARLDVAKYSASRRSPGHASLAIAFTEISRGLPL